jgi:hypothetical protein
MRLALKSHREFLMIQLRRLLKGANKEGLKISCLVEGDIHRELRCSHAGIGAISWSHSTTLNMYASRGEHWTYARLSDLDFEHDLDIENILMFLSKNLQDISIPGGQCVHPLPQFSHPKNSDHGFGSSQENSMVDDLLLEISEQECADFFRSRFLTDAPKKMLYEGSVCIGVRYLVYVDENNPFIFRNSSYFNVHANLRTRKKWLKANEAGQTLRQMRLAKIRPRLSPFWKTSIVEIEHEELPKKIIFNHNVLLILAEKLNQALQNQDAKVWSWLKAGEGSDHQSQFSLSYLDGNQHSRFAEHPFHKMMSRALDIIEHPPGGVEEELGHILNFEYDDTLIESQGAIYLQDISVELNLGVFHIVSRGSALILRGKGQVSEQFTQPICFSLTGEDLKIAVASKKSHFFRSFDRTGVVVPDFCILNDINVRPLTH